MSKVAIGDQISELTLPSIDNSQFSLDQVQGKRYLLSFFRFASCPFCNLRVHELVTESAQWSEGFTVVAIFDSSLENLQRHAEKHESPFPILADEKNIYYERFGVERSWLKTLWGALIGMHRVIYSMFVKGFLPTSFGGKLHTMPLDILVNEEGLVERVHYGQHEGDHIAMDAVRAFAAAI